MDTRNGNLYRSEEAAREAGVPSGNILGPLSVDGEIVTILNGPFKGRQYRRNADGTLGKRVLSARQLVHVD